MFVSVFTDSRGRRAANTETKTPVVQTITCSTERTASALA